MKLAEIMCVQLKQISQDKLLPIPAPDILRGLTIP